LVLKQAVLALSLATLQISLSLTEELDLETSNNKFILIAESFSSPLALMLNNLFPNKIGAIILGAGFCKTPINPIFGLLPLTPIFLIKPPRNIIHYFLTGSNSSNILTEHVCDTISNIPAKILSERLKSVLSLEDPINDLSAKKTPTLILQSQTDALISPKAQRYLEKRLTHAKVHWIDSSHLIFQTEPKICAKHIIAFLQSVL